LLHATGTEKRHLRAVVMEKDAEIKAMHEKYRPLRELLQSGKPKEEARREELPASPSSTEPRVTLYQGLSAQITLRAPPGWHGAFHIQGASATHGRCAVASTTLTYTPPPQYIGPDCVSYTAVGEASPQAMKLHVEVLQDTREETLRSRLAEHELKEYLEALSPRVRALPPEQRRSVLDTLPPEQQTAAQAAMLAAMEPIEREEYLASLSANEREAASGTMVEAMSPRPWRRRQQCKREKDDEETVVKEVDIEGYREPDAHAQENDVTQEKMSSAASFLLYGL